MTQHKDKRKRKTKRRRRAAYIRKQPLLCEVFRGLHLKPWPAIKVGVFVIRDVILHMQAMRLVFPRDGIVYGRMGAPSGSVGADGYVRINTGDAAHQYAHRLVWEAVNGPIGARYQIDHLNGDKADNRILNLDRATQGQNLQRARLFGLSRAGEQCANAVLTEALVRKIRETRETVTCKQWAEKLGICTTTVRSARVGKTWKHVREIPKPRRKVAKKRRRAKAA